jgi:hypothetical protein
MPLKMLLIAALSPYMNESELNPRPHASSDCREALLIMAQHRFADVFAQKVITVD